MSNYRPFQISVASCGLGHVTRGIETWAQDLTDGLRDRGVPVGCFRGSGPTFGEWDVTIPCVKRASRKSRIIRTMIPARLGWRFGLGSPYTLEQTTFAQRLIPQLRERQVEVLHVQDPLVALAIQRATNQGKCPTRVILGHGTEEPIEFLRQIDFVQHLAPWHLEQATSALNRLGISRPFWTAIPNFVDTQLFKAKEDGAWRRRLELPSTATVVLCAAAIKRHHKRIDYLIDEFATVVEHDPQANVYLVVAGAREQETDELIRLGKERLKDRVRFLTDVPRAQMPSLFQMADLFTLCSLEEMMPIALLEAIASGLPCLIHDRPVMRWMAGPAAVVGDFRTSGEWARVLTALLKDEARQSQLSRAARRHCEMNFSTTAVIEQLMEYYAKVRSAQAFSREVA